jgi:hypothetical protein
MIVAFPPLFKCVFFLDDDLPGRAYLVAPFFVEVLVNIS